MWFFVRDYSNSIKNNKHVNVPQVNLLKDIKHIINSPQNWLCAFYAAILNLPILVLGALWADIYLVRDIQFGQSQAADISMMIYVGMLIGSPFCGWFSDRIRRRKMPIIMLTFLAFIILLIILSITAKSITLYLLLFLLLGAIASGQVLGYSVITESNPHTLTGTATGLASIIIMGLGAIFQPLFGNIIHHYGYEIIGYRFAMVTLLVTFIINIVIAFFIRETYGKMTH